MAIVRELLIRLGFQTDKKAINETNRAITGFKTRFTVAATAATYAFKRMNDFFGDIAKATLDSSELANTLGLSLKELISIQNAAQKIGRLDFSQTDQAFIGLNKLLNDFRSGTSTALSEIARGFKFEIDSTAGPKKLFDQILEGLSEIENQQDRIRISSNIFGDSLGVKIASLAENINEFKDSVTGFENVGKEAEKSISVLREYEISVNSLTRSWDNLVLSLSKNVVPVLTNIINILKMASDGWNNLFKSTSEKIKFDQFKKSLPALAPLYKRGGGAFNTEENFTNSLIEKGKGFFSGVGDYISNRSGYDYSRQKNSTTPTAITVNNDISVPPGTDSEMTKSITESIFNGVQEAINYTFYQIQNNNPVVE